MTKKLIAETIGTFALVFCGTGAIVIDQFTGGTVTHAGIAITFGLIEKPLVYTPLKKHALFIVSIETKV